jgi:hypothetical protein
MSRQYYARERAKKRKTLRKKERLSAKAQINFGKFDDLSRCDNATWLNGKR